MADADVAGFVYFLKAREGGIRQRRGGGDKAPKAVFFVPGRLVKRQLGVECGIGEEFGSRQKR